MNPHLPFAPEVLEALPDQVLVSDSSGRVVQANARALRALALDAGAFPPVTELFPFRDPDLGPEGDLPFEDIARAADGREFRVLVRTAPGPRGSVLWLVTDLTRQQDDRQGMIDYMADLTTAQAKIRDYTRQIEVFRQIVDGMDQGVILTDPDQRVGFSNAFANELFGVELTGRKVTDLKNLIQSVEEGSPERLLRGEVLVLNEAKGRQTRCYLNVAPLSRQAGVNEGMVVWTFFELTEEIANTQAFIDFSAELATLNRELKASNGRILQLSRTDALTGAASRQAILEVLGRALDFGRSRKQTVGVLQADLDQLKELNAGSGQSAGDDALRKVYAQMLTVVGETGTVGRYGGGEFLAVLPGLNAGQVAVVADEIRARVARDPSPGSGVTVTVAAACWKADESLEKLLQRADQALNRGKTAGRNRTVAAD